MHDEYYYCENCGSTFLCEDADTKKYNPDYMNFPGYGYDIPICPNCGADGLDDEHNYSCLHCEEPFHSEEGYQEYPLCPDCTSDLVSKYLSVIKDKETSNLFYDKLYNLTSDEAYKECKKCFPIIIDKVMGTDEDLDYLLNILEYYDYDKLINLVK